MAGYVDGFVMPLPKSNVEKYREIATTAGGLWIEHGALDYKECLAEDVQVGEVTSFPRSVKPRMTRRSSSPGSPTSHASTGTRSTPR